MGNRRQIVGLRVQNGESGIWHLVATSEGNINVLVHS
jgi:hypothetical protein